MKSALVGLLFPVLGGGIWYQSAAQHKNLGGDTGHAASAYKNDTLVIDNVTVVDVETGKLHASQRVVVVDNRIVSVGRVKSVKTDRKSKSAYLDAKGKYLIPGLWDMHTHSDRNFDNFSKLYIATGITGIRDAASEMPLDSMVKLRQKVLMGERVGPPRQVLSGHSIDYKRGCRRTVALHTCITDSADVVHLVDSFKTVGVDMLKTYALPENMYFAVAGAARRAGIPFGGHTMVPAIAASDSGATLIDHSAVNQDLTRGCLYHTATVELCRPIAETFKKNGTWWVPTWIFPPRMAGMDQTHAIYSYFDRFIKDFFSSAAPLPSLHDYLAQGYANADSMRRPRSLIPPPPTGSDVDSLGYLYVVLKAGLPMVAGTDTYGRYLVPGFSLHAELATYVAEGMTPLQALQSATINAVKAIRATDSLGTIKPGKLADLVLLDANPLEHILNTTSIYGVIANGRYFDRKQLDSLLLSTR